MFIEKLNKDAQKLQEFIDILFKEKPKTLEYKYNYDVSSIFNRHVLNGRMCLCFVDDEVILSDFSISVNNNTSKHIKQWIDFMQNLYGEEYQTAYLEHKNREKATISNQLTTPQETNENYMELFEHYAVL